MIRAVIVFMSLLLAFPLVAAAQPAPGPSGPSVTAATPADPAPDNLPTGYGTKRLVFASACPQACPWGEIGEFVRDAMKPYGYDILLCRNCNRAEGPRLVAKAALPPKLVESDIAHGTVTRLDHPVDFGVTEALMLAWAYDGQHIYAKDGPYHNLRLIAKIEDPSYLLVAVPAGSSITDLAQIRAKHEAVHIVTDFQPTSMAVLNYYGLDKASVESWGGSIGPVDSANPAAKFDVLVSSLGSPANNPESAYWNRITSAQDLHFLDLPSALIDHLVADYGMRRVEAPWGLLRGVDRPLQTAGRSGEAVFARADMPDALAFKIAEAIDRARAKLIWFARPYSLDPRTVSQDRDVPLHPGARRYYVQAGYLKH